jgi:hypothetical protein
MKMKHVRYMTTEEQAAALAALKRGPPPVPVELETAKTAHEMTEVQRAEFLAEHKRRFS